MKKHFQRAIIVMVFSVVIVILVAITEFPSISKIFTERLGSKVRPYHNRNIERLPNFFIHVLRPIVATKGRERIFFVFSKKPAGVGSASALQEYISYYFVLVLCTIL